MLHDDDIFCTECIRPGVDIFCTGGCHRSFHKTCLKCSVLSTRKWLCPDCEKGVHRCFVCKEFSVDKDLLQCQSPGCYQYYHPKCIPAYCSRDYFVCPLHRCSFCREWEEENDPFVKCVRCCKAYHEYCLPLEIFSISPHYMVCSFHRREDPPLPALTYELLTQRRVQDEQSSQEEAEFNELDYYRSQSIIQQDPYSKRIHY